MTTTLQATFMADCSRSLNGSRLSFYAERDLHTITPTVDIGATAALHHHFTNWTGTAVTAGGCPGAHEHDGAGDAICYKPVLLLTVNTPTTA
jgi:hypothetical protein